LLLAGVATVAAACGGATAGDRDCRRNVRGVGGPATIKNGKPQTPVFPLSGTVTFTDAGGRATNFAIGTTGTFSVRLAAGTYTVSG